MGVFATCFKFSWSNMSLLGSFDLDPGSQGKPINMINHGLFHVRLSDRKTDRQTNLKHTNLRVLIGCLVWSFIGYHFVANKWVVRHTKKPTTLLGLRQTDRHLSPLCDMHKGAHSTGPWNTRSKRMLVQMHEAANIAYFSLHCKGYILTQDINSLIYKMPLTSL